MSFFSVLTNDTISETWSGGNNKSDAWASIEADGGSITRKLGSPTSFTQNTVTHSNTNQVVRVHMGTWVTDTGAPEAITIPNGAMFNIPVMSGYESAGQLNAYVYAKISVVTESAGVLSYNRTLVDWFPMRFEGTDVELGTATGSSDPMGGNSATNGHVNFQAATGTTLAIGERIAVEVGVDVRGGRNGETANIEFGSPFNVPTDATLAVDAAGTGPYGSSVGMPFSFSEANQDSWGLHSEISVPIVAGTETIAWADVGTDWSVAKWQTTGASRYVMRRGGVPTGQFWCFQDDDYLYIATNLIIDGCIQNSDHQEIYLCPTGDWDGALETDNQDWLFRRSITAGTSLSRDPVFPILNQKSTDNGEYVLQGDPASAFPENWELSSYNAGTKTHTFTSNGYTWQDGVDFRIGGPGATSTAPAPTGAATGGAYSEFKIKKSKLANWNGTDPIGMMINLQCDVQGNGHTMYPVHLGMEVDKADWFWQGALYTQGEQKTSANQVTAETMDLRPLNSAHAHGEATGATYNPTETVTGVTTTQNGILNIGRRPSEAVTSATTTQNAQIDIAIFPSVNITSFTTTQDATVTFSFSPSEAITGSTTTQDAGISVGHRPTEAITGSTTTQDAQLDIAHIHGATFTSSTTTSDASIINNHIRTVTITGATTTPNANITLGGNFTPAANITATTTTSSAEIDVPIIHNPTETITSSTSTQDAQYNIGYRVTEVIIGSTVTSSDAVLSVGHRPSEVIIGSTTGQDAHIGIGLRPQVAITGPTTTSDAQVDIAHIHGATFISSTSTSDATLDINFEWNPETTITGETSTADANLGIQHPIEVTFFAVTPTPDGTLDIGRRPSVQVTGETTTSEGDLVLAGKIAPSVDITGTTSTQDAPIDIGRFPTVAIASATTTRSSLISIGHRVGVVIDTTTSTSDADITIEADVPEIHNPTATFPVYSRARYANLVILAEKGTGGGGGFPILAGGGAPRDSHADALQKRKLPTVKVLDIKTLNEETINININVIQVTDLLVEDG
jgi:hypothetical protein